MKNAVLQTLTDSQRAFVTAAESLGATAPAAARTSGELPRISARELGQLLDWGLVRESAQGSFYIYDRAQPVTPALGPPALRRDPRTRRQRVVKLVIMIILLFFPILFLMVLRLTNSGS